MGAMGEMHLFIENAFREETQFFFVSVVVIWIVSITLHELAHGWAAIWQGDRTPIELGHMTLNPIVHMGWFSIILLLTAGLAFGLMPVTPSRFRSRYGDALVSAAGPAMNLLIAIVVLTALGLWRRGAGEWTGEPGFEENMGQFLWMAGYTNVVAVMLNLVPIPPLDGSRILADFWPRYRGWVQSVQDPRMFLGALLALFYLPYLLGFSLFEVAREICLPYLSWVSGMPLMLGSG